MSRIGLISNCRNRTVWDRPATGTRLLPWPKPVPVSLGRPIDPLRISLIASAPSRPTCPPHPRAADARVHSPRMITHGSHPQRACPTTVDACGIAPRMNSRPAVPGAEADACGIAPRMNSRAPAQDAAVLAVEGALATLILSLFLPSHPDAPRGISHARPAIRPQEGAKGSSSPVVPVLPDWQGVPHSRTKRK